MPTARITEGEMIEIAQRFRALEDQIERADAILAGRCREHSEASDALEAKHTCGDLSYDEWCRRSRPHSEAIEKLEDIRAGVERAAEAARDDMVRMQEALRG